MKPEIRPLRIKPHHFVDIVARIGGGERTFPAHPFGHGFHLAGRRLLRHPETLLELELGADDICQPCIHNVQGICEDVIDISYRPDAPTLKREWNLMLDRRWCRYLALGPGMRLTGLEFCGRLLRVRKEELKSVYREIPASMTAEKGSELRAGVKFLLSCK